MDIPNLGMINTSSPQIDLIKQSAIDRTKLSKLSSDITKNDAFKKFVDGKLKADGGNSLSKVEDKKLMEVCQQFESMFIKQVFNSMRSTLNKEDRLIDGGMGEEIFSDMLYDEYSQITSKTAQLGLAKQIYDQVKDSYLK